MYGNLKPEPEPEPNSLLNINFEIPNYTWNLDCLIHKSTTSSGPCNGAENASVGGSETENT
jgi:hypothetical protein